MTITFEKLLENLPSAKFAVIEDWLICQDYEITCFNNSIELKDLFVLKEDNQSIPIINNAAVLKLRQFNKKGTGQYENPTDEWTSEYYTEIQETLETYDLVEYELSILVKQPFN